MYLKHLTRTGKERLFIKESIAFFKRKRLKANLYVASS